MHDGNAWVAMAFDFGRKRIGVATGDSVTRRATPLTTLITGPAGIDWTAIARLVEQWRPRVLVVGIPTRVDGSAGEITEPARLFARELGERHPIRTVMVDERYSSIDASEQLRESRASGARTRRVRREDIDAAAAGVILERWLQDASASGTSP